MNMLDSVMPREYLCFVHEFFVEKMSNPHLIEVMALPNFTSVKGEFHPLIF